MTEEKALKYLFGAVMEDGSILEQTPEDVSTVDPQRSAFFDVNQEKLRVFYLSDGKHLFLVDLQDGHFEIDGIKFRLHEESEIEGCKLKLEFHRRHWEKSTGEYVFDGYQWKPTGTALQTEVRPPAYRLGFRRDSNPLFIAQLQSIEENLPKMTEDQAKQTGFALLKTIREMMEHLNRKMIEFD